jgi:tRNA G18 (ribose-2'-O)-methylase SpoU
MFRVHHIKNLDLPDLQPYRTMRQSQERYEQGIFVAEGAKVVKRLLESDFTVVSVLLPAKWVAEFEPLIEARPEKDIPVYVVTEKRVLEELVGFSMFQGVLAVGRIPKKHSLSDVLERSPKPRLFAAVDGLTNAENLGALVRNCAAFNVQALIVAETSSSPFLRRAVRNSMGTIFQLPVVELGGNRPARWARHLPPHHPSGNLTLAQALRELRAQNIRCIAAHPHTAGRTLSQADFTGDCCVLFGSEGYGISPAALEICDEAVAIPMPPTVDSLNVGAAAAVFLYEANRQRRNMQGY